MPFPSPQKTDALTRETSIITIRDYEVAGDGIADDTQKIQEAIDTCKSQGGTVLFPRGTYRIGSAITLDESVMFVKGSMLSIDSGVTVTISGFLDAGMYQIFDGDGNVSLAAGSCEYVLPQWWGAVGDDSTDNYDAFHAAFSAAFAANSVSHVKIPAGTYQVSASLESCWGPGGVWGEGLGGWILEGAGQSRTIIKYTGTTGFCFDVQSWPEITSYAVNNTVIRSMGFAAPNLTPASYLTTTDAEYDDVGGAIRITGATNIIENCAFNIDTGTSISIEPKNIATSESFTYDTDIEFSSSGAGSAEKYAIKFVAPRHTWVKEVTVPLKREGSPGGDVYVEIWTDDGGSPSKPSAQIGAYESATLDIDTKIGTSDANYRFLFDWGPSVVQGTTYWIVIETIGYTNSSGNKLYLCTDADGTTDGTATYDYGAGTWSTSNDGADYEVIIWNGQAIHNRMSNCFIHQTGSADGTGIRVQHDSQIYIEGTHIDAIPAIRATGRPTIHIVNSFLQSEPGYDAIDHQAGYLTVTNTYIEGDITLANGTNLYHSSFVGSSLLGNFYWAADMTEPQFTNGLGPKFSSPIATLTPKDMWHRIYGAQHRAWKSDTGTPVLDTNQVGVDGYSWEINARYEDIIINFGNDLATDEGGQLPRGTYLITVYAMADNAITDDLSIRTRYNQGGGSGFLYNTIVATPATDRFRPYTILYRVGDYLQANRYGGIEIAKNTTTTNTIYISHFTIEYMGPDIINDKGLVLFSSEETDADGERDSAITWMGIQSGTEQSALAKIKAFHDDAAAGDNEKGGLAIAVNTGTEDLDPSEIQRFTTEWRTFTDADTTPSVANGNQFKTANTGATTITMFDDGVSGKTIKVIIGDGNTTIDFTGTNLKGNGGADWSPAQNDHMTCIFDGVNWFCDVSDNTP